MKVLETLDAVDSVDYLSGDGESGTRQIVETESAASVRRQMEAMKLIERRLDEAYAGCVLINLLIDHPWLLGAAGSPFRGLPNMTTKAARSFRLLLGSTICTSIIRWRRKTRP